MNELLLEQIASVVHFLLKRDLLWFFNLMNVCIIFSAVFAVCLLYSHYRHSTHNYSVLKGTDFLVHKTLKRVSPLIA